MIMIYEPSNTNFDKNGDGIINALQCKATFNLDGNWNLYLEAPIDENLKYLQQQSVISVNTPYGKKQRYRIYNHDKNEKTISVMALPVFFDSKNDCILKDVRPTNKNGQDAIDMMTAGTQYTGSSNISKLSTAYYVYKNLMEAINGSDDNSFLNRWGGEIVYQNTNITINEKIGEDRGLRAEFGFNIQGINESIEWENVVTRIYPKAYNGYMLPNDETVDSPNINKYPIVYTKVIEYQDIKLKEDATESDEENGTIICETMNDLYNALRERAQEEYENGIDVPNITYSVDMLDLSRTKLYEKYKELLNVYLGDIVHIKHKRLGIKTVERVITLTYDCIAEKVESLVLGDYEANYFNNVSSVTNSANKVINTSNNTLMADKIAGIINLLNTSLRAQKDIAQKQDVRAILFEDLDPDSPTFGALCIGTQGIQIAKKRNATDTDWQWGTAIDFQSINADYIITGILTDRNGNFYLDMSNGDLRMKNGTFVGNITGGSIRIGSNFSVDSSGNLVAKNANFQGSVSGSSISGTNITGGNINGSVIDTSENINVGTYAYLNNQSNSAISGVYIKYQGKVYTAIYQNVGQSATLITTSGNLLLEAEQVISIAGTEIYLSSQPIVGSDMRLKENIKEIDLTGIFEYLNIYEFNYIGSDKRTVGVIAQDFVGTPYEDIILSKNEKGYYSVDYNVINMAIAQFIKKVMKC